MPHDTTVTWTGAGRRRRALLAAGVVVALGALTGGCSGAQRDPETSAASAPPGLVDPWSASGSAPATTSPTPSGSGSGATAGAPSASVSAGGSRSGAAAAAASPSAKVSTARAAARQAGYRFVDDFDGAAGSGPDRDKWTYDVGGKGWGNGELQTYTTSRRNSFLDGQGHLVIRALAETTTDADGATKRSWTSARLTTLGKFSAYTGTFEARIKVSPQRGFLPAWWALGANIRTVEWPACGEIDLMENYGWAASDSSVHTPVQRGSIAVRTSSGSVEHSGGWHLWRMQWTETGGMTFAVDGRTYHTVSRSQLAATVLGSRNPMFLLLNLAVGGKVGDPPAAAPDSVDLLVDYVRVR